MPVGDTEDKKRWELYSRYLSYAKQCEEEATGQRKPWPSRAAKLAEAKEWLARAYHLAA